MATLYEQRNVSMKPELWVALEALAVQTNSRSTRGPKARQHSWQCLIERVANDEFELVPRKPYDPLPGLDEAIRVHAAMEAAVANEERQREQERVAEQQRRIEQHQKQAQKMPLKLEQMSMLTELEPA